MSDSPRTRSERAELAFRRVMILSLVYGVCIGGYFVAGAFGFLGDGPAWGGLLLGAGYFVGVFVVRSVTLGALPWRGREGRPQPACRDEWTMLNRNRAAWAGFWVMLTVQVPLMFVMANVPQVHSLVGMAGVTMASGLSAFFGFFLYFSRLPGDG